jgi:hypothetical protein
VGRSGILQRRDLVVEPELPLQKQNKCTVETFRVQSV